jgi:FimV-like protein
VKNFDQVLEKNIDVAAYRTNDNRLNRLSTLIPGTVYGPIISGETLGGVAVRIHAGRATLSQKLIALFEANSHAFMGENMNKLKVGEVLHIPNLEIIERYDSYHAEEVQTDQFRDYLTEVLAYER